MMVHLNDDYDDEKAGGKHSESKFVTVEIKLTKPVYCNNCPKNIQLAH